MDALRLENISFSYNGSEKIFDNVNFTLEYGDFVLLSGVSGEGERMPSWLRPYVRKKGRL